MSSSHFKLHLLILLQITFHLTSAQSNYADQANSIEYQPNGGLPEYATLDGKVTQLDELSPIISLNRTKAALNCAEGTMQIELKFDHGFHGIAYADFDRNSACQVFGKGATSYLLELPLKGCGTKQNPQRVFTNNIVVRFHPTLEMDGDEIITIVCRYPPPIAPAPPVANPIIEQPPAALPIEPPLGGFQILLIICAILFLSLLLLGLGCSYYCLRRRNMTVIRKHPFSTIGTDSEITKISGSSLGNLSLCGVVKIPRAHAPITTITTSSGSEGPLISDTLPSDYPSESSHSEPDDEGSLAASSSAHSYDNKVFIHDEPIPSIKRPFHEEQPKRTFEPLETKIEPPRFDVEVKVKSTPGRPESLNLSDDTESVFSEKNLSVITEENEERDVKKHIQLAPSLIKIKRKQMEMKPTLEEIRDDGPEEFEEPISIVHKPEITSHVVDDVFLRTITEKKTIEDVERHKRLVTEYLTKPKIEENLNWNVEIRNYDDTDDRRQWEDFSDVSSASGLTITPRYEPPSQTINVAKKIYDNKLPLNSPELVGSLTQHQHETHHFKSDYKILESFDVPVQNPEVPNWDVLIRVFTATNEEDQFGVDLDDLATTSTSFHLTENDKFKWKQIITTETFKKELYQSLIREDYQQIVYNYPKAYEPHKWNVILRILNQNGGAVKKSKITRRKSLPTLYENESETSEAPHLQIPIGHHQIHKGGPDLDLRSMSETIVDFVHHPDNQSEASSSYFHVTSSAGASRFFDEFSSLPRSLSQPSLARSASEFTERWIAPSRYDTASEFTTPEGTPKSQRSAKIEAIRTESRAVATGAIPRGQIVREKEFREIKKKKTQLAYKPVDRDWFNDDNDSDND